MLFLYIVEDNKECHSVFLLTTDYCLLSTSLLILFVHLAQ
jgi:hypothetical protein